MTDAPHETPDALRDRFAQAPLDRPLPHQLTLQQLVDALQAMRTANDDHAALCAEAAHRLLVMHQGNLQLASEGDRLRAYQRAANARIDDMRNNLVALNARVDDMRRHAHATTLQPKVDGPTHFRALRLAPGLVQSITEAIGKASMCWDAPEAAGTFNRAAANRIAQQLACEVADELDSARLRRRQADGNEDWRRRALEAEHRAETMQAGMLNAQLDRLQLVQEAEAREACSQAWRQLRADMALLRERITSRIRRLFNRT